MQNLDDIKTAKTQSAESSNIKDGVVKMRKAMNDFWKGFDHLFHSDWNSFSYESISSYSSKTTSSQNSTTQKEETRETRVTISEDHVTKLYAGETLKFDAGENGTVYLQLKTK